MQKVELGSPSAIMSDREFILLITEDGSDQKVFYNLEDKMAKACLHSFTDDIYPEMDESIGIRLLGTIRQKMEQLVGEGLIEDEETAKMFVVTELMQALEREKELNGF